jgi:ATP-independent RNA helicase DbpA
LSETSFSTLGLGPELLDNLASLGYETMTPIQAHSLPAILAHQDVIAQGKTGSGKTAAFGLGLLAGLDTAILQVQSLVLCPTRELADQVAKEIRRLARAVPNVKVLTLSGGIPYRAQADSLQFGAHIVVGTPGRIEDHLRKGSLDLAGVTLLVLDEDSVDAIVKQTPSARQTLLFSATYPDEIQAIARRIMRKPVLVRAETTHDAGTIRQHFYKVAGDQQRLEALRLLLLHYHPDSTVIFCNTRNEAQEIAQDLRSHGFSALALHGDLDQRDRDQTLVRFSNKSVAVLVATDVAARGLDIDSLDAVINYHIARDAEMHVHRIGRTGRAGNKGTAHSLISDREVHKVALLQDYLGEPIEPEPLPPQSLLGGRANPPAMETLLIDGGKRQKLRPGDILGALTGDAGIPGNQVGKIDLFDSRAYVAVHRAVAKQALKKLSEGKLKGRSFRVSLLKGHPKSAPPRTQRRLSK